MVESVIYGRVSSYVRHGREVRESCIWELGRDWLSITRNFVTITMLCTRVLVSYMCFAHVLAVSHSSIYKSTSLCKFRIIIQDTFTFCFLFCLFIFYLHMQGMLQQLEVTFDTGILLNLLEFYKVFTSFNFYNKRVCTYFFGVLFVVFLHFLLLVLLKF